MIDVMIITYNESLNLPFCLKAIQGWVNKIFIIDSGSDDGTQDIARSFGAQVVHHNWEGYARQKNWGLSNLPFESEWLLLLDADEVITDRLRHILEKIGNRPAAETPENGFFINRLSYFMGRPIHHCGYYPSWNLRLIKRGKGFYEDREVHEHVVMDDPVGYVREPMIHEDRRGLEHYIAKHNRYSTLEARSIFRQMQRQEPVPHTANIPSDVSRRRWLKLHVSPYIPSPGFWRFMYMYVLRLGVLDGWTGLQFCKFISWYDSMVAMKLRDLRRRMRKAAFPADFSVQAEVEALATPEGSDTLLPRVLQTAPKPGSPAQMQPEASPWTFREKVVRAIWMVVGRPVFRCTFHNWYRFRAGLLRLFGAHIGEGVAIRPTVNVEVPWMLYIDDGVSVGDFAILYSLGPIRIGKRSIVSQYAHLCAGTHDYTDHHFKLIRSPITIGEDAWIGADAFIGPNVEVGSLAVVGARSSVYKNLPSGKVYVGNPARAIKERLLR